MLFSYIFTTTKIGVHKCGWNQFWYTPLFLLCFWWSLAFNCLFFDLLFNQKSQVYCFLGLPIGCFLFWHNGWLCMVATTLSHFYKLFFHYLHSFFPWNSLKWASVEYLSSRTVRNWLGQNAWRAMIRTASFDGVDLSGKTKQTTKELHEIKWSFVRVSCIRGLLSMQSGDDARCLFLSCYDIHWKDWPERGSTWR